METRDKLPAVIILIFLAIVFYFSAAAAGEMGKQPWDMLSVFSFTAILIIIAVLIGLWISGILKKRSLKKNATSLSRTLFPDTHKTLPEILRNPNLPLPVSEEALWPPGELLHLGGYERVGWPSSYRVASLTMEELLVSVPKASEVDVDDMPLDQIDLEEGYTFEGPNLKYSLRYQTSDITRVVISHWGVTSVLEVWIRTPERGKKKVLSMSFVEDFPRSLVVLARKVREQGTANRVNWALQNERKIFDKELERQFRRAAPNASVVLKGRSISDEDFSWIVKLS